MTDVVSLESLAGEVARVHARLDAQAREHAEAELRVVTMLAGPETPEERRAGFTLVPGTARRRTAPRGRLRAVAG
ncbi:MAG TPA: hypothetical protein VGP26_29160 [Actinophytocola sp.]|jgi:hypothetical protein|nr:hypothetical protein [Actinophytocola sp.]